MNLYQWDVCLSFLLSLVCSPPADRCYDCYMWKLQTTDQLYEMIIEHSVTKYGAATIMNELPCCSVLMWRNKPDVQNTVAPSRCDQHQLWTHSGLNIGEYRSTVHNNNWPLSLWPCVFGRVELLLLTGGYDVDDTIKHPELRVSVGGVVAGQRPALLGDLACLFWPTVQCHCWVLISQTWWSLVRTFSSCGVMTPWTFRRKDGWKSSAHWDRQPLFH